MPTDYPSESSFTDWPSEDDLWPGDPFSRTPLNHDQSSGLMGGEAISTRELIDLAFQRAYSVPESGSSGTSPRHALIAIVSAPAMAPILGRNPNRIPEVAASIRAAGAWSTGLAFEVSYDRAAGVLHLKPCAEVAQSVEGLSEDFCAQRGVALRVALCQSGGVRISTFSGEGLSYALEERSDTLLPPQPTALADPEIWRELVALRWHAFKCPRQFSEHAMRTVFFQATPIWLEMLGFEWVHHLRRYQILMSQRFAAEVTAQTLRQKRPVEKSVAEQEVEVALVSTRALFTRLRHAHGHAMRVATARGEMGFVVHEVCTIQYSLMCDPATPLSAPTSSSQVRDLPWICAWRPMRVFTYLASTAVAATLYRLELRDLTSEVMHGFQIDLQAPPSARQPIDISRMLREMGRLLDEPVSPSGNHPNDGFEGSWNPRKQFRSDDLQWTNGKFSSQAHELATNGWIDIGSRTVPNYPEEVAGTGIYRGYVHELAEACRDRALDGGENSVFNLVGNEAGALGLEGESVTLAAQTIAPDKEILAWRRLLTVQATQATQLPVSALSHAEAQKISRLIPMQWTRLVHVPQMLARCVNGAPLPRGVPVQQRSARA